MVNPHFEVVLFDLGGVLIQLGGFDAWKEMTGQTDDMEVLRRWLQCPVVRDFERGHCSVDSFVHSMIETHNLPIGPEDFLTLFKNLPVGFFDGAREVVADVIDHVRVGCFSNTNDIHWTTQPCILELHDLFDVHFLSYKMGHVKPDAEAFHYVVSELACEPGAIFFIDDNIINVDAARAFGINAHVAKGPVDARCLLRKHGLINQ